MLAHDKINTTYRVQYCYQQSLIKVICQKKNSTFQATCWQLKRHTNENVREQVIWWLCLSRCRTLHFVSKTTPVRGSISLHTQQPTDSGNDACIRSISRKEKGGDWIAEHEVESYCCNDGRMTWVYLPTRLGNWFVTRRRLLIDCTVLNAAANRHRAWFELPWQGTVWSNIIATRADDDVCWLILINVFEIGLAQKWPNSSSFWFRITIPSESQAEGFASNPVPCQYHLSQELDLRESQSTQFQPQTTTLQARSCTTCWWYNEANLPAKMRTPADQWLVAQSLVFQAK